MSHANTLKLLFPLELTGVFDNDIALEGSALDAAETSAASLLEEMFADKTFLLLADWERVCGLIPAAGDTVQSRRDAVIRKLRELGDLSRQYYIDLAASMGWTITIDELQPFMCGWGQCGVDYTYIEEVRFIWRVNVSGYSVYSFRTGTSSAGEHLTWWQTNTKLESIINELKPAHTYVIFNYAELSAHMTTEGGDTIITESGDTVIYE
jgi:uncharacterized protein YmfQ (DUF2313 family)